MNNTTKIILGIAAGAIAGAMTGILIAPDDGRKTRKKIGKESDKLRNSISEAVRESLESAKSRYNKILDDYANDARKNITAAKNTAKAN